jgi:hypothetical protein
MHLLPLLVSLWITLSWKCDIIIVGLKLESLYTIHPKKIAKIEQILHKIVALYLPNLQCFVHNKIVFKEPTWIQVK